MIHDVRADLERMKDFPAMPEVAQKLLLIRSDPSVSQLAAIIELDPSIASQLIRYASSPFFAYGGKINSIRDAISRVLGLERALNIALSAAAGQSFKGPASGRLGRDAVWTHAIYSAVLTQSLVGLARTGEEALVPGMAYLCGLLHNIGFLVLGQLYPSDIHALHAAAARAEATPLIELERSMIGVSHADIGAWLMRKWRMPAELIVSVYEHHNESYQGQHAAYARLVLLADRLLKGIGMGDAETAELPQHVLASLGLEEAQVLEHFQQLLAAAELDQLAASFAGAA